MSECMWDKDKTCDCGGATCKQVDFGNMVELIAEHSGCGQGVQVDQLSVRLAPGDRVFISRGKLGKHLCKGRMISLSDLDQ